jgi:hypothetical protein
MSVMHAPRGLQFVAVSAMIHVAATQPSPVLTGCGIRIHTDDDTPAVTALRDRSQLCQHCHNIILQHS